MLPSVPLSFSTTLSTVFITVLLPPLFFLILIIQTAECKGATTPPKNVEGEEQLLKCYSDRNLSGEVTCPADEPGIQCVTLSFKDRYGDKHNFQGCIVNVEQEEEESRNPKVKPPVKSGCNFHPTGVSGSYDVHECYCNTHMCNKKKHCECKDQDKAKSKAKLKGKDHDEGHDEGVSQNFGSLVNSIVFFLVGFLLKRPVLF